MDLQTIDNAIFTIWQRVWNLRWLQPLNAKEERERFFATGADPRFTYRQLSFDTERLRKELATLHHALEHLAPTTPHEEVIIQLLAEKIKKLQNWIALLAARGTDAFTEQSLAYYGAPSDNLVQEARKLLSLNSAGNREELSSEEAAKELTRNAQELGFAVKEREGLASRADCVLPDRTLYLRKGATFSMRDIKKLAVHELGVHARRAVNGLQQPYKLFFMGTALYETTEEGLAGVKEEEARVSSPRSLKTKGGLVLAVALALQKSFRETYDKLSNNFAPEIAYRLVFRAKRGMGDTSKPGAFTKDYIYLDGLQRVAALTPEEREALFLGRIAVEDVPLLKRGGFLNDALLRQKGAPPTDSDSSGA